MARLARVKVFASDEVTYIFDNDQLSFQIRLPRACRNASAFGP